MITPPIFHKKPYAYFADERSTFMIKVLSCLTTAAYERKLIIRILLKFFILIQGILWYGEKVIP